MKTIAIMVSIVMFDKLSFVAITRSGHGLFQMDEGLIILSRKDTNKVLRKGRLHLVGTLNTYVVDPHYKIFRALPIDAKEVGS